MTNPSDAPSQADFITRAFGSHKFYRLWMTQVITSIGDWIGLLAITITAARVWGSNSGTAIGLVIGARVLPSLFFGQIGGVLADRWNRYRVLVVCDVGRAVIYTLLPFVDTVWQLVLASLIIEGFTMLWIPAKEALVPTLLPKERLAAANSLSAFATYGTFPVASGLLFGLTWLASEIEGLPGLSWLRIDEESLGFYGNALTFLAAAVMISSLAYLTNGEFPFGRHRRGPRQPAKPEVVPQRSDRDITSDITSLIHTPEPAADPKSQAARSSFASGIREFAEGWRFIVFTPIVRAVNFGLATALIGGGLLIPLGVVYVEEILNAGATGYVGVQIALGAGVGVGVLIVSLLTRLVSTSLGRLELFMFAVLGACISLLLTATFSSWVGVIIGVAALGVCAGFIYVLGFTILQFEVADDFRGRVFSALYSLVRLCLILSLVFGSLLSDLLDTLVVDKVSILGHTFDLPGVRLTLWLGGLIIGGAGFYIYRTTLSERHRLKGR